MYSIKLTNPTTTLNKLRMKVCLALTILFFVFAQVQVFAQTDVTSTYLSNAGFDNSCNYLSGGSETVSTADPGNLSPVTGWTIGLLPAWSAGGTFEYGWSGDFNGASAPASGSDGATGTDHGAMGLTVGWGQGVSYTQAVTLPEGKYDIVFAANFQGVSSMGSNITGWAPNSGSDIFSDLNSASLGIWVTDTVSFTLYGETAGNIQVGMQATASAGSGSNARLFVDYVKILYYGVDKTDLQTLVDSATTMYANQLGIPASSTVYDDLDTSITYAQTIIDDASASMANVSTAEDIMESSIQAVHVTVEEYADATLSDLTVDGTTITNFSPDVFDYNYNFFVTEPTSYPVPTVAAASNSTYATAPVIVDAPQVPGTTTITVTAGNGAIQVYSIILDTLLVTTKTNYNATFETLENQYIKLDGFSQITLTGSNNPFGSSKIDLVSTDAWIYLPNKRPSVVVDSLLDQINVNGAVAIEGSNIRVSQYLNGAMIIPHSTAYKPLTVYSGKAQSGTSINLGYNSYYKTAELGAMNNNINSFVLKRGYMATFASNEDGTGISRVYIADKSDITVNNMPEGLSGTASFVVVRQWRWVTKKAWRGNPTGALRFNATSHYDYNNAAYSTLDVEYIPMRHNPGWNAYSNFLDKFSSTHALGYNEPDNSVDDGYSTVEGAIAAWPSMMASGHRLGTPAVTDGGLSWLWSFLSQCEAKNYRVDFVAWHFYRAGYTAQGLYNTLKSIHEQSGGRPIWITEFNNGCNWTYNGNVPTVEENGEVIESFIEMLDTAHFVERYFVWDGCNEELRMTNSGTGELYPAGIAYRDLESNMAFSEDFYNTDQNFNEKIIQENSGGLCEYDGSIDSDQEGYTGSGFINTTEAAGSGITWKALFNSDGKKNITFRYASADDRTADLIINDDTVAHNLYFRSTQAWTNWREISIITYIDAGVADIRLESTSSSGLPNIDYIQITDGLDVDCAFTIDSASVLIQENFQGFCFVDGVIEKEYEGSTSEGIANTNDSFGTGINYSVNFTSDGAKTFTVRYASAADLPANLALNGVAVASDVSFPATGGLNTFSTVTIPFSADSGIASLRIEATTTGGLANIDYIVVSYATAASCPSDEELSPDLVLKHSYTFEDGTAIDVIGSAHGTLQGGSIGNGKYTTTSAGQYIDLPAGDIALNTYNNITLEAFVEAGDETNGDNTTLSYFGGTSGDNGANYLFTSLKSRAAISCNNTTDPYATETGISSVKKDDGKKHHLVCVVTSQEIRWYVDGTLRGKSGLYSDNTIDSLSTDFAYLCKSGYANDPTWMGSIEEFNVYDGIMNADSIANRSSDYLLELKHSYPFDDSTATDVIAGADGTVYGGEMSLGAYIASSNGNYIELPADQIAINSYNGITLEAYVRAGNGVNGNSTMLSYFGGNSGSYGVSYLYTSLKSRTAISCNSTSSPWSAEDGVSSSKLDNGGMYHIICVVSDETISWYINGNLQGSSELSANNSIADLSNAFAYLCKSGYSTDPTWLGTIYEFNIYEGVLTDERVSDRYNDVISTTYTITYEAGENGSISGTTPQTVNSGDHALPVTAVPNDGYYFTSWSDSLESAFRRDLYIGIDYSVTANFAASLYTVTLTIKDGEELIEGAIVNFDTSSFLSGADGTVTIEDVTFGDYNIVVVADGYDTLNTNINVNGNEAQELTLSPVVNIGINETSDNSVNMYPNPASSNVTIKADTGLSHIFVYDSYGRLVLDNSIKKMDNMAQIDIRGLEQGIYIIHIKIGGHTYIEKLIIE